MNYNTFGQTTNTTKLCGNLVSCTYPLSGFNESPENGHNPNINIAVMKDSDVAVVRVRPELLLSIYKCCFGGLDAKRL